MPSLPTHATLIGTAPNGTSSYTVSTSATASTSGAQAALQEWEQDTGNGDGTGTDDAATVSQGATINGQTTYYVTPNDSGTGNTPGTSGSSTTGVTPRQVSDVSNQLKNGDIDGAKKTFSDMLSDAWMSNPNIDINGLVQAVMRNAYEDNQQDLKYYALKVEFYNNLKKSIRGTLSAAREAQSTTEVAGSNNLSQAFTPPPQPNLNPPADGGTEVTYGQQSPGNGMSDGSGSSSGGAGTTGASGGAGTTGATSSTGATGGAGSTGATGSTGSIGQGLTEIPSSSIPGLGFNPPLEGDPNQWKVYETKDGHYVAVNFNQHDKGAGEIRVYQGDGKGKPGKMTDQVWGDPHMNTSGNEYKSAADGSSGFNQYGQFGVVLPDGTTISASSDASVSGVAAISSVDIASGNDHFKITSGPNQTGTQASTNMNDGASYIKTNVIGNSANSNLFALQDSVNGAPAEVDVLQGNSWQKVADQNNIAAVAGGNAGGALQTSGNATGVTGAQGSVATAQGNIITTSNQLDNYIQNQEDLLQSVGDDAQLAQVDLQNMAQKQQQTLQTLSNLSKSFHDLSMAIIRNISG